MIPSSSSIIKSEPKPRNLAQAIRVGCKISNQQTTGALSHMGATCALGAALLAVGQNPLDWNGRSIEDTIQYLQTFFPDDNYFEMDNVWRRNDLDKLSREAIADLLDSRLV